MARFGSRTLARKCLAFANRASRDRLSEYEYIRLCNLSKRLYELHGHMRNLRRLMKCCQPTKAERVAYVKMVIDYGRHCRQIAKFVAEEEAAMAAETERV